MEIETLCTFDTEYSADSVEWCLHPDYLEYFACGTYQLDQSANINSSSEAPCRRKGRIYLFHYETKTNKLEEQHRLETAAILDMKWLYYHSEECPILATANALGEVHIYKVEKYQFILVYSIHIDSNDDNLLALSLDWSPLHADANCGNHKLVVSDSKGCISLFNYNETNFTKIRTWSAHNFEAWTCTFDKWNDNCVFTGGDDITLSSFDFRDPQNIIKKTNHSHCAGVTSMLSHPKLKNMLLTGCYDEILRLFDTRNLIKPIKEISLGGGIWRIRADPQKQNLILCACMHNHIKIVKLMDDSLVMKLQGIYDDHNSLCYGSDWCMKTNNNSNNLIMATCSYYDHKLCISSVKVKDKESAD